MGTPPPSTPPLQAAAAWYRGGNNIISGPAGFNIFGFATGSNSPIYTETNGALREKLNGDFTGATQYPINTYTAAQGVNTSGYLLLGANSPIQPGGGPPALYQQKGAFSLLHLNGVQNSITGTGFTQEFGYRPWMKTGITFTGNNDLMYFGIRALAPGQDQSEMLVSWSDNNGPGNGPDDFAFRFMGTGQGITIDPDLTSENDLDGRHIARFAPTGEFGLGNTFGNNAGSGSLYVRPQSLLHMSLNQSSSVWAQITNEATGQAVADGFRWGMLGLPVAAQNGNAFLYNQEQRHIILSTGAATPASMTATNERMRITAIENPTDLFGGGYGINNPGALNTKATRVSISENPANPVTRPLSLLHLGFNTSTANNDGWRPWMDVGTFMSFDSDNMYVGLKNEGPDHKDAVINWGDNDGTKGDNLRFIFTTFTGGAPVAAGVNGLEGGRMTATTTSGVFTGFGGDPGVNLYGPAGTSLNATNTLEVNSWGATSAPGGSSGLRFTNLNTTSPTIANPGSGLLSVDANGDVIYVPANNVPTQPGNYCGVTPQNALISDYEIPMNNNNYYFTNPAGPLNENDNFVDIGDNCSTALIAKLQVHRGLTTNTQFQNFGSLTTNDDRAMTTGLGYGFGSAGIATGKNRENAGIYGTSSGAITNNGGYFEARTHNIGTLISTNNKGLSAFAEQGLNNYGIWTEGFNGNFAFGIFAKGSNALTTNYGVYGVADVINATNRAGYFDGKLESTVPGVVTSDQMFKENVQGIKGATDILKKMKPHTYNMKINDFPQFNFDNVKQYGFIAQEVEQVLPELVTESTHPGEYDSTGTEIHAPLAYKSLNYNAFIPIAVKAINELGAQIDKSTLSDQTIKTNVQNLSGSLAKVKQMRGVTYEWNSTAQNNMGLDSLKHIGFIAQEINAIEPLLTFVDDSSLMHVNYDRVVPMLVESIKDLDSQLQHKDSALAAMQDQITKS